MSERSEPILEPDLPIVDPHHHLWDRPARLVAAMPKTTLTIVALALRLARGVVAVLGARGR